MVWLNAAGGEVATMTDLLVSPPGSSPRPLVRPGRPNRLPRPRGQVSEQLLDRLIRPPHEISALPLGDVSVVLDDDVALALHLCYELHYLGLAGVNESWEWNPSLLRERQRIEAAFERELTAMIGPVPAALPTADVVEILGAMASAPEVRSLSSYVEERGTIDELRELAIHRSAYQLKEADPHTWGIPRLTGQAKAALVEIQRGEYGNGDVAYVHANLFAEVLHALDVDHNYAAHLDRLPGVTLSTGNLISYFGLHRRWRGALVGHLALFEMCSVRPMARYANALRRMGVDGRALEFYDEHVRADADHGVVALDEMVPGLLGEEPLLGGEVVFGARALDAVERRFADHLLDAWSDGRSSLRPVESAPLPLAGGPGGNEEGLVA